MDVTNEANGYPDPMPPPIDPPAQPQLLPMDLPIIPRPPSEESRTFA